MALGELAGLIAFVSHLGRDVIEPIKEALYDETVKGGLRLAKYEVARAFGLLDLFAATFDEIADTEPHMNTGYGTAGLIDIFDTLLRTTVIISILIGEEMSEELLLELLQEGVSNAIQTSIGGAFQTIFNVYRGGQPVYTDDITNVMRTHQYIDDKLNVFNIAGAGSNLPATLQYLMQGHLSNLGDVYTPINQQLISILTRALEEELWMHLTYVELARVNLLNNLRRVTDIVEKYIELTIEGIEDSLSRINDMIQNAETEIARLDAELTTEEDAELIKTDIETEFNKLKEVTDEWINNMMQRIDNVLLSVIDEDVSRYQNALSKYRSVVATLLNKANEAYYNDLLSGMQKISLYLDMLLAYRYYSDMASYTEEQAQQIKFVELSTGGIQVPETYTVTVIVYGE